MTLHARNLPVPILNKYSLITFLVLPFLPYHTVPSSKVKTYFILDHPKCRWHIEKNILKFFFDFLMNCRSKLIFLSALIYFSLGFVLFMNLYIWNIYVISITQTELLNYSSKNLLLFQNFIYFFDFYRYNLECILHIQKHLYKMQEIYLYKMRLQ